MPLGDVQSLRLTLPGGLTEQPGAAAATPLLEEPARPTAVNDRCAIGLLDSFIRSGIPIPGDVSIVEDDDDRLNAARIIPIRPTAPSLASSANLWVCGWWRYMNASISSRL